jgi:heptosyltransferase-1
MRILIIRTSALGDVVHCLPVLTALRRQLPEARIGWLVERAMAPLLAGHPQLDEVLTVGLRPWRKRPFAPTTLAEVGRFFAALDRFAPEVVLDLMGSHKGGVLAAVSLADHRLGLARRFRREPSSAVWISHGVEPRGPHAVERALSVLDGLGLPPQPADFNPAGLRQALLGTTAATGQAGAGGGTSGEAGAARAATGPPDSRPLVLIHPGAGWGNKTYPPQRWGEVARQLAGEGLAVQVTVSPGEEPLATAVATASGGAAEPVEAADLPALTALLDRARLVLGGDTGPLHLAHALGTPVLMVMGPTDPATHGPYGAPANALAELLPCSFCHQRLDGPRACLLRIPASRVARRARELLAGVPEPAAAGPR